VAHYPFTQLYGLNRHRIRIEKEDGSGVQANEILDRVSSAVENAKESFSSGKPASE
jgi:hypothetical protein